jgi:hypothetical protein
LPLRINGLIDEACQLKCCKLCRHSWLPYDTDYGLCKNEANAYGHMPKRITELGSCEHWEKKDDLPDMPRER